MTTSNRESYGPTLDTYIEQGGGVWTLELQMTLEALGILAGEELAFDAWKVIQPLVTENKIMPPAFEKRNSMSNQVVPDNGRFSDYNEIAM